MKKTIKKIFIFFNVYDFIISIHHFIFNIFIPRIYLLKPKRFVIRDNIKYELDLSKIIDMHIFRSSWEPWVVDILKKILKPGDTVIEAGSNIGAHSLLIAKLIEPNGRLFAFEPTSYAFFKLLHHININNLNSIIKAEKIVLSNLYLSLPVKKMVSDFKIFDKNFDEGEDLSNCSITSIDEYCSTNNIKSLKLIKIDVDGYDYKVLEGSRKALEKSRPVILIELANFTLKRQGDSVEDIFNFFVELNYTGFYLSTPLNNNYMWGKTILSANEIIRISGEYSHVDSIFIPNNKVEELRSSLFD